MSADAGKQVEVQAVRSRLYSTGPRLFRHPQLLALLPAVKFNTSHSNIRTKWGKCLITGPYA